MKLYNLCLAVLISTGLILSSCGSLSDSSRLSDSPRESQPNSRSEDNVSLESEVDAKSELEFDFQEVDWLDEDYIYFNREEEKAKRDKRNKIYFGVAAGGIVLAIASPRLYRLAQYEIFDEVLKSPLARFIRKNHGRFPFVVRKVTQRIENPFTPKILRDILEYSYIKTNTSSNHLPYWLKKKGAGAAYMQNPKGSIFEPFRKHDNVVTLNDPRNSQEVAQSNNTWHQVNAAKYDGTYLLEREYLHLKFGYIVHESAHHYFDQEFFPKVIFPKLLPRLEKLGLAKPSSNNKYQMDEVTRQHLSECFAFYSQLTEARHAMENGEEATRFNQKYFKQMFDIDIYSNPSDAEVDRKIQQGVIKLYNTTYPEIIDDISKISIMELAKGNIQDYAQVAPKLH